jgi:hypothetical protein
MSNVNIFQNNAKSVPMKADEQIVRVNMEEIEIGGRKSHLPAQQKSGAMTLSHVPNGGSLMGGK